VKVVGEDELVTADGQRQMSGRANKASQAFVASFTKVYSELADRAPVYAELRNLIDLAVAAAYIKQHDLYGKSGWKMPVFADEKQFAVETFNEPKQAPAAVNAIWKSNKLMTPVGGGVDIQPLMALEPEKILRDEGGKVGKLRQDTRVVLGKGQWWWD
jgi:hypothetical protein